MPEQRFRDIEQQEHHLREDPHDCRDAGWCPGHQQGPAVQFSSWVVGVRCLCGPGAKPAGGRAHCSYSASWPGSLLASQWQLWPGQRRTETALARLESTTRSARLALAALSFLLYLRSHSAPRVRSAAGDRSPFTLVVVGLAIPTATLLAYAVAIWPARWISSRQPVEALRAE